MKTKWYEEALSIQKLCFLTMQSTAHNNNIVRIPPTYIISHQQSYFPHRSDNLMILTFCQQREILLSFFPPKISFWNCSLLILVARQMTLLIKQKPVCLTSLLNILHVGNKELICRVDVLANKISLKHLGHCLLRNRYRHCPWCAGHLECFPSNLL